ncbi:MAG: hypothetical protein LBV38_07175 [Alistipes sp.]|jgi:TonB family protein|nr:hypothetical protein [Alistipes sp.]
MNYYEDDNRGRLWGIAGAVLYLALCAGVMFVTYTVSLPEPELGILVDFGTGDTGSGDEDLAAGDTDVRPVTPQSTGEPVEIVTTDDPEVEVAVPDPPEQNAPPTEATPTPTPEPVREVDRRALFPGRTEGSAATSQGTAGSEGNQGTQEGGPGGGDSAGGSGWSGTSDLGNRREVGNWPMPQYNINDGGRIVISVVVDKEGKVLRASYRQEGSTFPYGELARETERVALRARFTPSEDREVEGGTITYIFKSN